MTIFNCGFKFQNATHVDTVKQHKYGWTSSSAVGIDQNAKHDQQEQNNLAS